MENVVAFVLEYRYLYAGGSQKNIFNILRVLRIEKTEFKIINIFILITVHFITS